MCFFNEHECVNVLCLIYFRVKGMYAGQVRPKMGCPGIFPTELEADMALYLKHCDLLRIPKTQLQFKEDIQHYVKYNDLTFKLLTEDGPGKWNGVKMWEWYDLEINLSYSSKISFAHYCLNIGRTWCDRFAEKWKELVTFRTKGIIFRLKNDPITMKSWVHEHDFYTKIQKTTKAFPAKVLIMVLETSVLELSLENKISLHVLVNLHAISGHWIFFLKIHSNAKNVYLVMTNSLGGVQCSWWSFETIFCTQRKYTKCSVELFWQSFWIL